MLRGARALSPAALAAITVLALAGPGAGGAAAGPATADPAYEVDPGKRARHTNGTPRDYAATDLGSARVRVALFECANARSARGGLVFERQGGAADPGDPDAGVTQLNGEPVAGSPPSAGPVRPDGSEVTLRMSGSDGCARPVVYRDRDGDANLDVNQRGRAREPYGAGGGTRFEPQGVAIANGERCDPLDPAVCMFPFPNDHFTAADPDTDSGRRIAFESESMPRNRAGMPIDPAAYNRSDGFSPGQMMVTKVPGLETREAFDATDPVPITDFDRYEARRAPVVVIDADTGERHPIWTELDANPEDPEDVALLIRPAVNFSEGHRYIVALRRLRDAEGEKIRAQRPFQLLRDRIITSEPSLEGRRAHFERLFRKLARAGIDRRGLYLAWDFTVASERNLSERMLSMRDDAFGELGDSDLSDLQVEGARPTFAVTSTTDYGPCGNDGCAEDPTTGEPTEDDEIARKVQGTVTVPCYLDTPACPPGSRFNLDSSGLPQQNSVPHVAQWECLIPRAAVDSGPVPARPSLYGHGLLGDHGEVEAGNVQAMANEHNFVFCATDWAGFATQDAPTVLATLQDLSNFPRLVDRMQQGFLNFTFLGRLMLHPEGFAEHPAFRLDGESLIDPSRLFYDGNSQGGIMGGGLTAVAPDFERAVLGVPAMNYSTLLRRSSDFAPYAEGNFNDPPGDTELGLYDNYPDELERPMILSMVQMLWDRGEANGYAHHMTADPLPNTPSHEVLMHVAFGDHQVTNVAAEVEARTIGARAHVPALDPGRIPGGEPLWRIPPIEAYPYGGSALVYWDSGPPREGDQGVVNPPLTNTPPGDPEHGRDPHGDPRADADARMQKSEFLRVGGAVVDVCAGAPCYTHGWTGPGP
jgi:hypothetical protein